MTANSTIQIGMFVKFPLKDGSIALGKVVCIFESQSRLFTKLCNGTDFFPWIKDSEIIHPEKVRTICIARRLFDTSWPVNCRCIDNSLLWIVYD